MSVEWLWVLLPPTGWALWSAGGTGWKPARRIVYPLLLSLALLSYGTAWWRCGLLGLATATVAHMGYGTFTPVCRRGVVGLLLGLSLLPLGIVPLVALGTSSVFLGAYWLSLRHLAFTWKLVEGLTGLAHAGGAVWIATH